MSTRSPEQPDTQSSSSANAFSSPGVASRRRAAQIELGAPAKPRKYHGASATSRSALQKSLEQRIPHEIRSEVVERLNERLAKGASPDAASPAPSGSDDVGAYVEVTREKVERKRYMNMLAARRSRVRKAEHTEQLQAEVETWKQRVAELEAKIREGTIECQRRVDLAERKRAEIEAEIRFLRSGVGQQVVIKREETD